MSIIQGNAHTSAGGGYQIERSLRFNSADSAYLNRTLTTPTDGKKFSFSFWAKRSALSSEMTIFAADAVGSSNESAITLNSGNTLEVRLSGVICRTTTQLFRDPSAWYHIVIALDTTQATANDRVKVYLNGTQITAFTTTANPTQNSTEVSFNTAIAHYIGRWASSGIQYFDGYLTETYFIDGQAKTPSDFGETDSATGVWKPKAYSGTYGTNGFYLKFADNSGTTSTTLGKDSSGNGNNWTPNNFSVTAGAGNDSLVDSPTSYGTDTGVGGTVRGNYATWNPLATTPAAPVTFSNGNLDVSFGSSLTGWVKSSIAVSSGKWYVEITVTAASDANMIVGIVKPETYIAPGDTADSYGYLGDGRKYTNGTGSSYGASWTTNDVIGVALDMDAGSIVFYKNGASQGTAFTGISGTYVIEFADTSNAGTRSIVANFGQRAFAYTAPSGFKALCTQNLPTPTIGATSTTQANDYFNAVLYTGNGYPTSGTQSISGVGFQPDFVWIKYRSGTGSHSLYDAIRGATKGLFTNLTNAEETDTNSLTSLNSDGFSVGTNSTGLSNVNVNSGTYVAWNWKANGAGSSNTAGTITSTVSANTTSGFSIVTYTGNFTASQTVGHGLSTAPVFIIAKRRGATSDWGCIHPSLAATQIIRFNLTGAAETNDWFANTRPTSSVFYVGQNSNTNPSGGTMVAYCFAPVAGYSAFGSYTGNGSTDGPFVYTGFRPAFVIRKCSSATSNWFINDAARNPSNVVLLRLNADLSDAESSGANSDIDFLSNGFKIRATSTAGVNQSGQTHIYMAFAEVPMKYSLGR